MPDPQQLDAATLRAQSVRRSRFAMAAATYLVVILATPLIESVGLGSLKRDQWLEFVALAAVINLAFLALFLTHRNLRFPDPSLTATQIVVATWWGLLPLAWLPRARPLILMMFLIAFSFGMLQLGRRQYLVVTAIVQLSYGGLLVAERYVLRPDLNVRYELFLWILYGLVLAWFAFFGGFVSRLRHRLQLEHESLEKVASELRLEIVARRGTQEENERLIDELRSSLARVRRLSGLLPICAACKKIRDDKGYWNQIEAYISSRSEAEFSHGICPECSRKLAPELDLEP